MPKNTSLLLLLLLLLFIQVIQHDMTVVYSMVYSLVLVYPDDKTIYIYVCYLVLYFLKGTDVS